jgi:adenine-specific DNA methylase
MDPPYYDNVMYAELSDFFYVWLKRTAGLVYPELFRRKLTDKENEAIANTARFKGQKGAKALAGREYQDRMAAIFAECRRVLKHNGIMTLMFTHKATGAWDALTKGLMKAGFIITASWPINTEAEGSLHIKDKAAANSTIFLVCRPRPATVRGADETYWEDVEPEVAAAVRKRVKEFQDAGIGGVDLYLASFGPALEEFSKHWPLRRGTPRPEPEEKKRRVQAVLFEELFDPYAVTPEDALDAARKEVKRWRLEQLSHRKARAELDPVTSFFVLAWDAFKAPAFDYDEALRLARAVGVDLDKDIVGRLAEKKGSDIHLWDSARRAAKGALGPADGSRGMIDAIHHGAHAARTRTLAAARELLERARIDQDARFYTSLQAVLEVLPVSKAFSGIDLAGDVLEQSNDFEVLENLRRLAFAEQVDKPVQLLLFEGAAE